MKSIKISIVFGVLAAALATGRPLFGGELGLVNTTRSPHALMYMPNLSDAHWTSGLWGGRFEVCRTSMIPYMWNLFQHEKEEGDWTNFLAAAGYKQTFGGLPLDGKHHGPPFSDGDFFKWFEAASQVYAIDHDPKLLHLLERIVPVIAKAQRPDGYLFTQATLTAKQDDKRVVPFADPGHFEAYNLGHLMTAACVYYRATGQTSLLDVARKAADFLDRFYQHATPGEARVGICPSHYMGLITLYRTTGDVKYLDLARKLIELRDHVKDGTDQNQDRVPFTQMTQAVGHAVRANYLYAGVADLVAEEGDPARFHTLKVIARNVYQKKLYITGQTGALYDGVSPYGSWNNAAIQMVHQAYGRDYQLPNLTAYNEGCATVGYCLWTWRMFLLTGNARYSDLFERSLYNGVLAGINLRGDKYFYSNPLRKLHAFKVPLRWWRNRQPNIPQSFCCPPNLVRTIAEAQDYIYTLSKDTLWVNLYGASTLDTKWIDGGGRIKLRQETDYPWNGAVKLIVGEAPDHPVTIKLRIPGWSDPGATTVRVNGAPAAGTPTPGTYFDVTRLWKAGDVIDLDIRFHPQLMEANPLVEETLNQVAVQNGPIVYCLESNDLPKGVNIENVALSADRAQENFTPRRVTIAGAHLVALSGPALDLPQIPGTGQLLYRRVDLVPPRRIHLSLIPYFAWDNRGDTNMTVWLPVR